MLKYKESPNSETVKVYYYSKYIGRILKEEKGYVYNPKATKMYGDYFPTLNEVKKSLSIDY